MAKRTPAYAGILAKPLPDLRRYIERLPEKDQQRASVALRLFQAHNVKDRIDELFKYYGMTPPRSAGIPYTREHGPVGDAPGIWGVTDDAAPWCNLAIALASDHVAGLRVAGGKGRGRPKSKWPEERLARLWIDVSREILQSGKQDCAFAVLRDLPRWSNETEAALKAAWRDASASVLGGALAAAPTRLNSERSADRARLAAFLALAEALFPEQ